MSEPTLKVTGSELVEAARFLRKTAKASEGSELVLSFETDTLTLEVLGTSYQVGASGDWPGTCRVPKRLLDVLVRQSGGDVTLQVLAGERLHIGEVSVDCIWSSATKPDIEMPLNPSLLEILRVAADHSPSELAAAGLLELVIEADGKMKDRIARATEILRPFGDSSAVLRAWVEAQVAGR